MKAKPSGAITLLIAARFLEEAAEWHASQATLHTGIAGSVISPALIGMSCPSKTD